MNLQSRAHRRLQRHRTQLVKPSVPGREAVVARPWLAPRAEEPLASPHAALLRHLAGAPDPAWPAARLQAAAQALMQTDEALRQGLRAGELSARLAWFQRLLALWPAPERDAWMLRQQSAAQGHALAASPLHTSLDPHLFDNGIAAELRLRLQALWLAMVAPGAVCLDADRREREQSEALALLDSWLH